jgi:hypothetical protein
VTPSAREGDGRHRLRVTRVTDGLSTRDRHWLSKDLERRSTMLSHRTRIGARLIGGCALFALLVAIPVTGQGVWISTLNHVTVTGQVALPGVVLSAGEYTFEAIRADVVRVSSRDGRRVFYTGFTHRVPRPRHVVDAFMSLDEGTPTSPPAIQVWYPLAGGQGHEFIYR